MFLSLVYLLYASRFFILVIFMKKEKANRQKIRRYLDGLYSKSEVSDLLKSMQDRDMQSAFDIIDETLMASTNEETPVLSEETEIITAAAKNEKPDANDKIIEGMVKGRINKELKEICLLDQVYVKAEDGKQSVSAYVASVAKENNANIKIKGFVRFETGEGIEKKNEDFAAEVAAQLK